MNSMSVHRPQRGRRRWQSCVAWVLGLFFLVSGGVYGCNRVVNHTVDRLMVADIEESADPALLVEAAEYGGWVLPSGVEVLLVKREIIRDRKYRIAVRALPADLAAMLEKSRFPDVLVHRVVPYPGDTIAGPPLETSPRIEQGQEAWFTSSSGKVMIREVTVDVRDEWTRIVHIEFRGV